MKVFISYSRLDASETAKAIHNYLTEIGHHEVFLDTSNIRGGDEWWKTIQENISDCDIFVIIVTPSALYRSEVRSEVEKEVLQAQKENKKIIPCFYRGIRKDQIKWGLDKIQGIEFSNEYQLVLNLYPKIKNYEKDKKPIDGVSESFSKTVESTTTASIPPTKSDIHKLHENKDTLQTPIGTTGAISGNDGVPYIPKYRLSESDNNERKYPERDGSKKFQGINQILIIILIIAVAIIGVIVAINYFNGLANDENKQNIVTPPSSVITDKVVTLEWTPIFGNTFPIFI